MNALWELALDKVPRYDEETLVSREALSEALQTLTPEELIEALAWFNKLDTWD